VAARGLVIALAGTAAGIVVARATASLMSGLLYGIESSDIATTSGVAIAVLLVAVLASVLPARAGAGVDPVTAIRVDA
jgi:ABC-type antimicrobial peptide transport system permease subunit